MTLMRTDKRRQECCHRLWNLSVPIRSSTIVRILCVARRFYAANLLRLFVLASFATCIAVTVWRPFSVVM